MPLVSVIIPSYNHEKFVRECIQSVFDQTFQDFEIIITDDASTDHTVKIIEQLDDSRIKLFKHSTNRGVSVAVNNCIRHASGRYFAWLSTDDVWYPEKLEIQVRYLNEHPNVGVVFGKVDWIDESGNLITDPSFPYLNLFNVENRTRAEWLRQFFLIGNCLSLPCSLVRKECFEAVGLYNPAYAKIPDLDLWIRICFKYDIAILDQKLIQNRWIGDESNASGGTLRNRSLVQLEHKRSLDHYLQIKKSEELLAIFPNAGQYGEIDSHILPYFLGRIAVGSGSDYKILWGLDVISALLQDEAKAGKLEKLCSFTYAEFLKLSNECDPFNLQLLAEREHTIETLLGETTGKQQIIETLATQLEEKERQAQDLFTQLIETQRELEGIKNSRSWRYTRILRQIRGKLH